MAKDHYQFLLLEFIEQRRRAPGYWEVLGHQLAQLHKCSAPSHGLDHNNYIGSLAQSNKTHRSWLTFFIEERLSPLLKLAIDDHHAPGVWMRKFETLYARLPSLLPDGRPSLLHGDLWSGNVITGHDGLPCLIDPAVYYGHREADLAMTHLFGGFEDGFYSSYESLYPLPTGFSERIDLYNLYPLLVHFNLFGASYAERITNILKRSA